MQRKRMMVCSVPERRQFRLDYSLSGMTIMLRSKGMSPFAIIQRKRTNLSFATVATTLYFISLLMTSRQAIVDQSLIAMKIYLSRLILKSQILVKELQVGMISGLYDPEIRPILFRARTREAEGTCTSTGYMREYQCYQSCSSIRYKAYSSSMLSYRSSLQQQPSSCTIQILLQNHAEESVPLPLPSMNSKVWVALGTEELSCMNLYSCSAPRRRKGCSERSSILIYSSFAMLFVHTLRSSTPCTVIAPHIMTDQPRSGA